mgnify:CR=1 FL=1
MFRVLVALTALLIAAPAIGVPAAAAGGLTPPPPIHIPYGGKVVTEVNLSDDDVLGMMKQMIPVLGDVMRETMDKIQGMDGGMPPPVAALAGLDMTGLAEAIQDIRNVRLIIARYSGDPDPETLLRQFNDGVAKAGRFNKIASDFGFMPGMFAMYAESGNSGYMAAAYDASGRTLYAARIVGSVDMPKLIKWVGSAAQLIIPMAMPPMGMGQDSWPDFDANTQQFSDDSAAEEDSEEPEDSTEECESAD